jgi:hypothetical protein
MIRPLAVALLALSAFGLAACGEDAPSGAGSPEAKDKARQAALKFASCMREEGIDMPDPGADGRQDIKIGGDSGISPEDFERASKACEKYRKDIRREVSAEDQQKFKESALAHSRCMREHGINFPDPTFDAEGGASVRMEAGRGGKKDPENDPKFKAAEEACGHLLDKGTTTDKQP